MRVFHSILSLQKYLNKKRTKNSIGFVPTMGALHDGHLALVKRAIKENDIVVVSIFVNPTQFDKSEDLKKYPRTLDTDVNLLKTTKHTIVFAPSVEEMYQQNIKAKKFHFDGLEYEMEGKHRNGHFDGVGTIVKRLFEIVQPHKAYFGEKDFQQLQIIKKLVDKYQLPVKIIGCKIHREADGLAMSSRNTRLTKKQRDAAPFIYQILKETKNRFKKESIPTIEQWVTKQYKNNLELQLEYFEIANSKTLKPARRKLKKNKYRAFVAAYAGNIRLIDNIALN
ncbi:MAG: pantoate--beta-alanine ligase [Flavobacteriaceae bacterium]|nr:pantoate--beta-alanine ligase [Flavobacteriaceae bacterium]